MNVLFTFDLHTLRQDPWFSVGPVTQICQTLARYAGNPSLWNGIRPRVLLTKYVPDVPLSSAVRLPHAAEVALREFAVRWDDAAISAWCDLMRGEGKIAEIYWDVFQWLVGQYGVECFAYWGSNGTIRRFCESAGLHSVAMELGPTRPPFRETRYCDFMGVNGDAHTRQIDIARVPGMDLEKWRADGGVRYPSGSGDEAVHVPLTTRHARLIYRADRPCALLVLQLDDDSNCLVHSDYSGMREMVGEVLPKLVKAGWRVFVKPHPGAAPERNAGMSRWMNVEGHAKSREFVETNFRPEEVVWLDDVPAIEYTSLIDKMDLVVSVNSSMGFEAMLSGKVVVALGNAPYKLEGVLPSLDEAASGNFDRNAYHENASRVCNLLLNHYLQPADLLSNPSVLGGAIRRNVVLEDAWRHGADKLTDAVLANPISLIGA